MGQTHDYSHTRNKFLRVALPTEPTTCIFSLENLRRGYESPAEARETKNPPEWEGFLFGGAYTTYLALIIEELQRWRAILNPPYNQYRKQISSRIASSP